MRTATLLWVLCAYHARKTTALAADTSQIVLHTTATQLEQEETTLEIAIATPPTAGGDDLAINYVVPGDEDTRYEDSIDDLLLYRVWYDDDEAWTAFLRILAHANYDTPDSDDDSDGDCVDFDDPSDLPYTIMDDRAAYSGATKDAIRTAFRAWVDDRSPARDGAGVAVLSGPHAAFRLKNTPRYRFCLYVDRDAMLAARSTYTPYTRKNGRRGGFYSTSGYAVLVDAAFDDAYYDNLARPTPEPDESEREDMASGDYTYEEWLDIVTDGDDGYPPVEGRESLDVGWCFVRLPTYSLCEALLANTEEWDRYYKRPPLVYPDDKPLSEAR
ncbi:hypothetical protein HMPREF1624_02970 [Sporothrix schenckii ATCC 58251]|uniref:Uncharacterized protein n=1 Tax=Sporothrix schenckii (strain ATCC 58251 / de Perez 2211183) TaxID=1391915 RepID=U7PYR2_SPOS1|nr:hypothetical protein HMPREF1624_02970 [Sporothrix schenckii ATCC 58251]